MRSRLLIAAAVLMVSALALQAALGANTNSGLTLAGLPRITLSSDADSATVDELDPGAVATKRAAVLNCNVHGSPVVLLVRLQKAGNGLFLDIVADATIGEIDTRVGAMNLSGRNHPSPTEDAVDTAIMAAAAGD